MVTIVLLGGISIFGGRGTIVGVLLAVAILGASRRRMTLDAGLLAGSEHRRRRAADRERDRPERRRSRPARRAALAERACAATHRAGLDGGRVKPARRCLRDRPGGLLAAVRGAARAARGLPAPGSRSGSRRSAPRSSPPVSSTRREAAREAGERFAAGARRARHALHGHVRDVAQVLPAVQAAKAPVVVLNLQPTRSARLRGHDDRRVARQLLGLLRAGARGCVHAGAGAVPHGHRNAARRRPGLGRDRATGSPRPAPCGPARARASASSATPIPGCSTCTRTSRRCMRRPARTSRCSRSTISQRASRRRTPPAIERKGEEIRSDVRPRRPGVDPIADEIDARGASTGRRASRSASTGWPTTSRSTG